MYSLWLSLFQGLGVGFSLIVAIGPQNAFVINQGLKRQQVLLTALICSLSDIVLIAAGVWGFGALLASHPLVITYARWFGAIFLTLYGCNSLRAAWRPQVLTEHALGKKPVSLRKLVIILLTLSFLNPHAYLDGVVLIGSIAAQYPVNQRPFFGMGAMLASFIWFFVIAYGAGALTPVFKRPLAWRIFDTVIGLIMLLIACMLSGLLGEY